MLTPTHIISILTNDRRGILRSIVSALSTVNGRHVEISQTIVHHAFTITLVVSLPDETGTDQLTEALRSALGTDCAISVIAYAAPRSAVDQTDRYILTAIGPLQRGVVQAITTLLLERGGNITDFSSKIVDDRLQMLAEVDLPADIELDQLQIDLQHVSDNPDLAVRLQHHRLFLATNEIAYRRNHVK